MGVFTKEAEVSTPLPPAKAFKAFAVDIENLMPKVAPQTVKSVEVLEGNGGPGTIRKITFAEGHGLSHAKHKVDVLDKDNLVYAYTVMESDFFNNKIEKISYDIKFVAAADGGSTVKVAATFYTAGDTEVTPDLMAQIKEASEKRALVMKAIESYVLANPDA
ncbi:major allergen Pru ar 1 [Gossypium raimondii]|uniref:Bet v I/Major latex protein domain-containing protein n=1 Tax=Gossypium raimondii TaxID=29730 RepID=A0A0D2PNI1_GOSRA|nr:major allergen Pru ar 1 [Gossypium raimondii]KJB28688.1 hypothetical protein B456_005G062700 [Gossypium raimondii]MBA0585391.1 hypothetical protein [Gossypium raimondii]